jgi:hypothetical protein
MKNTLLTIVTALALIFTSCDKNEEPQPVIVELKNNLTEDIRVPNGILSKDDAFNLHTHIFINGIQKNTSDKEWLVFPGDTLMLYAFGFDHNPTYYDNVNNVVITNLDSIIYGDINLTLIIKGDKYNKTYNHNSKDDCVITHIIK